MQSQEPLPVAIEDLVYRYGVSAVHAPRAHITRVPQKDDAMRLLRTAEGGFINAEKIVRLADERGEAAGGWVAILGDGEEVALAPYYSAPGRIKRDLPHLVAASAPEAMALADGASETCCCEA